MKLPPIASLRAFEAAARRQSFRHAGDELGMSAAAVSQHVKSIEDWLGLPLFERRPRGVQLTAQGRELGEACSEGLGHIAITVERLLGRSGQKRVSLACQPSMVTHWLAPRLPAFRAAHPDIQVSIVYPLSARTPEEAGADLLIRHGTQPDRPATAILGAATRPTCSTDYLQRVGPISKPSDLLAADLLHDETEAAWSTWLTRQGLKPPADTGPIFADFNLLVSSVLAGLGIGLCPTELVAKQIDDGHLTVLFDQAIDEDKFYWLLEAQGLSESGRLLQAYLLRQTA
ncbi:transcriptional regulator, LysR family [Rhizobium sp. PDO1-076]|uniref:LysR substrate-binding domain-containing protein n=1 Tax=Rhizobium sp. PDO1-076 TaxID=1125979 RepID=UPI00024E2B2E|nr:LysR substrate-binding domain-containing protein [Rhizobium sp. PDO1-076]EHS51739.1 transcriptional regulator, LysR family [Rhizobium sp. PDO1-076]